MRGLLKITLKSDLCAAVGKGFAAVIDTDTALTEAGLPYIPARRLKGCLREVAEYCMEQDDLDRVFGKTGSDTAGTLRIADAKLANEEGILAAIAQENVSPARVTDLYCGVRSETAIEDDRAKDNSLRFTRTVNRLDPLHEGKELCFFAPVEFEDGDKDTLCQIFSALRNIGYRRNRGFGAVECSFEESKTQSGKAPTVPDTDELYVLRLRVRLNEDMMLPDTDAEHSADCIAGTSVLGAFAAKYIAQNGDAGFNELFYSDVSFGNLYPVTANGGTAYPAPRFLAKIKAASTQADKGVKNLLGKQAGDTKQYKPVKSGYFSLADKSKILRPEQKIVYHNALTAQTDEGGLYIQHCLNAGQSFAGEIRGSARKLKKLCALLAEGDTLAFGRSKTAQYADCTVTVFEAVKAEEKKVTVKAGQKFAYVLESDAVLTDECGIFAPTLEALTAALNVTALDGNDTVSNIKTKVISGYNAKWNLKKPQFPAIGAGSCLILTAQKTLTLPETLTVGEKQNEGFGRVRVIADAVNYLNGKPQSAAQTDKPATPDRDFVAAVKQDNGKWNIIDLAIADSARLDIDIPSQIGRLTLMLKEADEQPEGQYENFCARIESIKTESVRESAQEIFAEKNLPAAVRGDWTKIHRYALTLLTVKKYQLRMEGKKDD